MISGITPYFVLGIISSIVGDISIYTNLTSTTIISINDNITIKIDKITTKSHKDFYLPSQTQSSSSISGILIPTIMSSNKCGTYNDGIYVCKNNKCCSKSGHCGDTEKYCGKGCQNNYGLCYSKSSRCVSMATVTMVKNTAIMDVNLNSESVCD
ncbi:hypothetical protein U3516DRAFT_771324 [Neocallimastix sp. 'constans']